MAPLVSQNTAWRQKREPPFQQGEPLARPWSQPTMVLTWKKYYGRRRKITPKIKEAGQIIATSHDLTPNGGLVWFSKGNPLNSGKSRLVKYYNLARRKIPILADSSSNWLTNLPLITPWKIIGWNLKITHEFSRITIWTKPAQYCVPCWFSRV